MLPIRRASLPIASLTGAAAWIFVLYWVGLSGPFLLDDHWNLAKLGEAGGISSVHSWLIFVFSGEAGILGRPISLASFTLNALNWPADPWPFKLTNLLIHIANTFLLFGLAHAIFRIQRLPNATILAVFCALLWATHPLHVSTVLYVVQRMAQLAALFTFAGVWAFLHGRMIAAHAPRRGYVWMFTGVGGGTAAAVLCKENGALLPLMALTLEVTVLRFSAIPPPPHWNHGAALLLRIPALSVLAYLVYSAPGWLNSYLHRDFDLFSRLGSQGPILCDYLGQFLLPGLRGNGLFRDISASDYTSFQMLLAWAGILAILIVAWWWRRSLPVVSAGLLWFFAGHVMESTILPLELYFEHRNYLPLAGLLITLSAGLAKMQPRLFLPLATILLLAWSSLTYLQAKVWGNPMVAAAIWAQEHPDSLRAVQFASATLQEHGNFEGSRTLIRQFVMRNPENATGRLQLLELDCVAGEDVSGAIAAVQPLLAKARFSYAMPQTFNNLFKLASNEQCSGLTFPALRHMLDGVLNNRQLASQRKPIGQLLITKGSVLAKEHHYNAAIATANSAGRANPKVNASYWKAIWLLEAGDCHNAAINASEARRMAMEGGVEQDPPAAFLDALDAAILSARKQNACHPLQAIAD
jgi:protein O-mannosyl-transferase